MYCNASIFKRLYPISSVYNCYNSSKLQVSGQLKTEINKKAK